MKRTPVAFSSVQLSLIALLASPRFFTRPQLLSRIAPSWGGTCPRPIIGRAPPKTALEGQP
jgi:hypothetical protein